MHPARSVTILRALSTDACGKCSGPVRSVALLLGHPGGVQGRVDAAGVDEVTVRPALDHPTAVDPSTEVRIQRALDSLTRGRTSIAIAHRLSTAQAADEVIVVDAGRIVERGHHTELVDLGGVYSRLHESWVAQQQAV